jgi:hypothetical protein
MLLSLGEGDGIWDSSMDNHTGKAVYIAHHPQSYSILRHFPNFIDKKCMYRIWNYGQEVHIYIYLRLDIKPSVSASGLQWTTAFPGYAALELGTSTMSDSSVYCPDAF